MPFNIILTYTNTSRVNAFRRLLVFKSKGKKINQNITIKINELIDQVKNTKFSAYVKTSNSHENIISIKSFVK